MRKKKIKKELDKTITTICEKVKTGTGMTEQQIGTVSALASLISARALLDYESESSEDLFSVKAKKTV